MNTVVKLGYISQIAIPEVRHNADIWIFNHRHGPRPNSRI